MDLLLNKTTNMERIYENAPNIKNCIALCLTYWSSGIITQNKNTLYKAFHLASTDNVNYNGSVELQLLSCFLHYELKDYEKGKEILNNLSSYKNHFKNSDTNIYLIYLYLSNVYELMDPKKLFSKGSKAIELVEGEQTYLKPLLLAMLSYEKGDYNKSYGYLMESFEKGCRSSFMYILFKVINFKNTQPEVNLKFISNYMSWSLCRNINLYDFFEEYSDLLEGGHFGTYNMPLEFMQSMYSKFGNDKVLYIICQKLISAKDYSLDGYHFYKIAENKQIMIEGLNEAIINCALINKIEDISRYAITNFLLHSGINTEASGYIFHLMLTSKKHMDLLADYEDAILQFACYALESGLKGKYYNSIYKFYLDTIEQLPENHYIKKAQDVVYNDLFQHEVYVNNSNVEFLWVRQKEYEEMEVYRIVNNKAIISAVSKVFDIICIDGERFSIIDDIITVSALVENNSMGFMLSLYESGYECDEILISLSSYYWNLDNLSDIQIEILEKASKLENTSEMFINRTLCAIGKAHYNDKKYALAIKYFNEVDYSYVNENFLEEMLIAYFDRKQMDYVVNIITKKKNAISDKTLFFIVKKLILETGYEQIVCDIAYDLIINSWYDKKLLECVLNNYNGSQKKWYELSDALSLLSIYELKLDEIILENCVFMHTLDFGSQNVFNRIHNYDKENKIAGQFAYYLVYEILVNETNLLPETIETLEKMFLDYDDDFLGYALMYLYILHDNKTKNTSTIMDRVMESMEENKIIFPVIKETKDYSSSYIEKNMPFVYRSIPGKNVYLYYKFKEDDEYKTVQMKYVKFGLYMVCITQFYNENIIYHFSEEMSSGSIATKKATTKNEKIYVDEKSSDDYFKINNALIYEQMFRYDEVEKTVAGLLSDKKKINANIL